MCDINGPFHLCTCESAVDRSKPHWVLHRQLQSREKNEIMGEFSIPDPYTTISERSLQRRLNSVNVFDFYYKPVEGDYLELFLNPTIDYDEDGEAYDDEYYPEFTLEFRKGRWHLLDTFESYNYTHKKTQSGEIIGPKSELTIAYFKNILPLLLIATFLFACDLKPIDYSKKTRKSSYARSSTTQTGQRRKAHARMGVSSSKRAFKNRINSRSYYNRNKHRRKLRKGNLSLKVIIVESMIKPRLSLRWSSSCSWFSW
ncbi:hypothetical protein [Aquirufa sp. A-Brett2-W8]